MAITPFKVKIVNFLLRHSVVFLQYMTYGDIHRNYREQVHEPEVPTTRTRVSQFSQGSKSAKFGVVFNITQL